MSKVARTANGIWHFFVNIFLSSQKSLSSDNGTYKSYLRNVRQSKYFPFVFVSVGVILQSRLFANTYILVFPFRRHLANSLSTRLKPLPMTHLGHIAAFDKLRGTLSVRIVYNKRLRVVKRPCRHTRSHGNTCFSRTIDYRFTRIKQSTINVFHCNADYDIVVDLRIGSKGIVQYVHSVFTQNVIQCQREKRRRKVCGISVAQLLISACSSPLGGQIVVSATDCQTYHLFRHAHMHLPTFPVAQRLEPTD